jgi:hypothetical protein
MRPSSTTRRGVSGAMAMPSSSPLRRAGFGNQVLEIDGHLRQVGRRRLDVEPTCLDPRQVEHVVDEVEQVGAALGDRFERLALRRVEGAVALQQLGVAEHAVQRLCAARGSCWRGIRSSRAWRLPPNPWRAQLVVALAPDPRCHGGTPRRNSRPRPASAT